ncbi:hydrogenase expression/formation protein HupK [Celeribacter sp. ULVN23_4]
MPDATPDREVLSAMLPPAPPVARLAVGKPVDAVVALIPRLFNLCRGAQDVAIRMALGLEVDPKLEATLAEDFIRDHLVRLGIILPRQLGLESLRVGLGARALLPKHMPETERELERFLKEDAGFAPVLRRIDARFAPYEATADVPALTEDLVTQAVACENSVAARHSEHPLMQVIEQCRGRGPLWRTAARMLDMEACLNCELPEPLQLENGWVVVPASRGAYAMRAEVADGVVTRFERVTPTDHMMAPGGIMAQSLAGLPEEKHGLAQLLIDVIDPCSPVILSGGSNREGRADA